MSAATKMLGLAAAAAGALAFDMSRTDNVVGYWGQNSVGASGGAADTWQKDIGAYCDDDSIDTFPISFLTVYHSTGGLPEVNLANICNGNDQPVFEGSQLPNCAFLEAGIKKCQAAGKTVTISMGGATGGNLFTDDAAAATFATQVWDLFLGGSSETRPFGSAVLDGVDLDIEGGSSAGYVAFVEQLRKHFDGADKKYYVTAAPQCPFPDAYLGPVLDGAFLDAVYIQFYNNYCAVTKYDDKNAWNWASWEEWAETKAPNKDVKLYIGAPSAEGGANPGNYVPADRLAQIATETRASSKHFGGVMYWDVSQAVANGGFHKAIKNAIRDGSAPAPPPTEPEPVPEPEPTPTEAPAPPAETSAPAPPTETEPTPGGGGEAPSTTAVPPTETEDPCPPESTETAAPEPPAPVPTPTEDPCPPEETAAPEPTPTEDPCPPEETAIPDPTENIPAPTETADPCPPEETAAPPTPTEDPCPPEETAPPAEPTADPCPPEEDTGAHAPGPVAPAPPPTPNTAPSCAGAKAWNANDVYTGGQLVSQGGKVFKAGWWNVNEQPDKTTSGVWTAATCPGKRDIAPSPVHANIAKVRRARPTPVARVNPHGASKARRDVRPTPAARYNPHGAI